MFEGFIISSSFIQCFTPILASQADLEAKYDNRLTMIQS